MPSNNKSLNRRIRELAAARSPGLQAGLRSAYLRAMDAWVAARRLAGRPPWIHVLVCGFPRSGTSLLYNMLSATLQGFECQEFEVPARTRLTWAGLQASKNPLDVMDLASLASFNRLHKRIVVIIPLRDPRDLLTSIHPKLPDRYFIGWDHSWWPGQGGGPWAYNAAGLCDVADAILRAPSLPGLEVSTVRYEDLVADPDAVQGAIARQTGLDLAGTFSSFHERPDRHAYRYEGKWAPADASLVRENKAADAQRAGKWRDPVHRQRIAEQFSACPRLFDILRDLGYEQDDRWFDPYRGTAG